MTIGPIELPRQNVKKKYFLRLGLFLEKKSIFFFPQKKSKSKKIFFSTFFRGTSIGPMTMPRV